MGVFVGVYSVFSPIPPNVSIYFSFSIIKCFSHGLTQ